VRKSAASALALGLLATRPAAADLVGDADTLAEAWRREGATVARMTPVFLGEGEIRTVTLPPGVVAAAGCVRIAAVAERQIGFVVAIGDGDSGDGAHSDAGAAVLDACGDEKPSTLRVAMLSSRATVEIIVAAHDGPIFPLEDLLPARAPGPLPPPDELVGGLEPPPYADRLARLTQSAQRDGAGMVVPVNAGANDRGLGAIQLRLSEGCHRLSVLGSSEAAVDVDAELWLPGAGDAFRRDRSHAPDARLDFCLGDEARIELRFAGVGSGAMATVVDALWPLPAGLPSAFGAGARAGMASALFRRRAPVLATAPDSVFLGGASATVVPLDLEPRACYVAALGRMDGAADGARLTVTVGGEVYFDDADGEPLGAAVSFCAGDATDATLQVDFRSTSAWWALGLWRVGGSE
jgi:hypothetical protein